MNESLSMASSELKIIRKQLILSRLAWIDAARGFCIILVVFWHAIGGLIGAGIVTQQSILGNIDYFIYTFHIHAFL
jgi:fucose 4-O-acetylase-like acetyltransferase